jgi:pimeloyl-ACP methyl ester carboxylesterase
VKEQLAVGIPEVPRAEGWNVHASPDDARLALTPGRGGFDLRAAAAKLSMPMLVATGAHDPNLESSRELVTIAPDARCVEMLMVGHGSVLQRPDLTTEIFLDFIAQGR